MTTYDYKTELYKTAQFSHEIDQDYLKELGSQGWRMINFYHSTKDSEGHNYYLLIFIKTVEHEQVSSNEQGPGYSPEVRGLAEILWQLLREKEGIRPFDAEGPQTLQHHVTHSKSPAPDSYADGHSGNGDTDSYADGHSGNGDTDATTQREKETLKEPAKEERPENGGE